MIIVFIFIVVTLVYNTINVKCVHQFQTFVYTTFTYVSELCSWMSVCVCVCVCMCVCVFSHGRLFATPWTVAHQALLSMEFSRQEYWSVLPCPSPYPGIEPMSLGSPSLAGRFFTTSATRSPTVCSPPMIQLPSVAIQLTPLIHFTLCLPLPLWQPLLFSPHLCVGFCSVWSFLCMCISCLFFLYST